MHAESLRETNTNKEQIGATTTQKCDARELNCPLKRQRSVKATLPTLVRRAGGRQEELADAPRTTCTAAALRNPAEVPAGRKRASSARGYLSESRPPPPSPWGRKEGQRFQDDVQKGDMGDEEGAHAGDGGMARRRGRPHVGAEAAVQNGESEEALRLASTLAEPLDMAARSCSPAPALSWPRLREGFRKSTPHPGSLLPKR